MISMGIVQYAPAHGSGHSPLEDVKAELVRADRLPPEGIGHGVLKFALDIAIEVLSSSETASALQEKLHDYRVAGTSVVWVVDPVHSNRTP